MSYYDVNVTNTNRELYFIVQPVAIADSTDTFFRMAKGPANDYPRYNAADGNPSAAEELRQIRTNLVVRALSLYTKPIYVSLAKPKTGELTSYVPAGTYKTKNGGEQSVSTAIDIDTVANTSSPSSTDGQALVIGFETDRQGEYFMNSWPTASGHPGSKHHVQDLDDVLGQGGVVYEKKKTKPGLRSLLDDLASTQSTYFTSGTVKLPSGRTATATENKLIDSMLWTDTVAYAGGTNGRTPSGFTIQYLDLTNL